jgi:hypothetical protein
MEALRDGQRRPNGIKILTYATRELPDNIICGYEWYSVKRFYPNPLTFGTLDTGKKTRYVGTVQHLHTPDCVRGQRNA